MLDDIADSRVLPTVIYLILSVDYTVSCTLLSTLHARLIAPVLCRSITPKT